MAEPVPAKEQEAKKEEKKVDKRSEFDRPRHLRFLKHCLNVLPSPYHSPHCLFSVLHSLCDAYSFAKLAHPSAGHRSSLCLNVPFFLITLDSIVDISRRRAQSSPSFTSCLAVRYCLACNVAQCLSLVVHHTTFARGSTPVLFARDNTLANSLSSPC